jgi:hypothetical protein
MLAGPACWFVQLLASNALDPAACPSRPWLLPLIGVVLAGVLVAALALSYGEWKRNASADHDWTHLLRMAGMWLPAVFLITILWQCIAVLVFAPCSR